MKTTKDILFDKFEQTLIASFPELPVSKIRKAADLMAEDASIEARNSAKTFSDLYSTVSKKSEQHKYLFREHIELIQKNTDSLMRGLHENNIVTNSVDRKSGKAVLKPKSIFAKELVLFLEKLDESVQKFYVDVYEIKDAKGAKELGFQQNTLF